MKLIKDKIDSKVIIIAALIFAAYVGVFVWAFSNMGESFYTERTEKTSMLMNIIVQNIETAIEGEWDTLHQFANVFTITDKRLQR